MTITVTQDDIDKGLSHSCTRCPIALAIARVIKHPFVGSVTNDVLYIVILDIRHFDCEIDLPKVAKIFVCAFDTIPNTVIPFEFDLNIPEKYLAS